MVDCISIFGFDGCCHVVCIYHTEEIKEGCKGFKHLYPYTSSADPLTPKQQRTWVSPAFYLFLLYITAIFVSKYPGIFFTLSGSEVVK